MTTHPEILIRSFEARDQQAARQLVLEGLGEHFGFIDESLNPDLDDIMTNYIVPGHIFLVAQHENRLIGTGALLFQSTEVGQIVRVSTVPAYRRKGVGKAVVEQLIEEARRRELKRLLVSTNNDWYNAIRLYQSLGFVEDAHSATGIHMKLDF